MVMTTIKTSPAAKNKTAGTPGSSNGLDPDCKDDLQEGKGGQLQQEEREIPIEIDDHFRLFGKEPWEVEYGERCQECQSRIDEYGFCSCGASGD